MSSNKRKYLKPTSNKNITFSSKAPLPISIIPLQTMSPNEYRPVQTKYWQQLSYDWNMVVKSIEENNNNKKYKKYKKNKLNNNNDDYSSSDNESNSSDSDSNSSSDSENNNSSDSENNSDKSENDYTIGKYMSNQNFDISEIIKYQSSSNLLLQKDMFKEYVDNLFKEIIHVDNKDETIAMDDNSYTLIQYATEAFIVDLLSTSACYAYSKSYHKHLTLLGADIKTIVTDYYNQGKICPFTCTIHRQEAQKLVVEIVNNTLTIIPIDIVNIIDEYFIDVDVS